MDFKNWKLTSHDGKKANLTHKDGHFMSIAVKGLPRIYQQQLARLSSQKLADGGSVGLDPDKVKQFQSGFAGTAPQPTPTPSTPETQPTPVMTSGRQNYDDGSVDPSDGQPALINGQPATPGGISDRLISPDQTLNVPAAVGQEQDAIAKQGELAGAQARGSIAPEQEYIRKQQDTQKRQYAALAELSQHAKDFDDYQKQNPINPRAYTENMSSHQKGMTALGLMLGGMGGGLTGQPNQAADYLNKQIDRDIDSQKANFQQRNTIWGAYKDLYGDNTIANNMAKVASLDILNHKKDLVAAQLGTPTAAAAAQRLGAEIGMTRTGLLNDSSGRLGLMRVGSGSTAAGGVAPSAPGMSGPQTNRSNDENSPIPGELAPPVLDSILHPGAAQMMLGMKHNPMAQQHLPKLEEQYAQAQQADKALAELTRVYGRMAGEAKEGGTMGRIHRSSPHALAVAGGALGAGAGALATGGVGAIPGGVIGSGLGEAAGQAAHSLTSTDVNRRYDVDKSALFGILSSALKGLPVNSEQIGKAVDDQAPDPRDSAKTLKQKLKELEKLIKNNNDHSLLDLHGLTNKKK
jgi:hypothetical protein